MKLGKRIDIVMIWFGSANGQMSSFLSELSARDMMIAGYYRFTFLLNKRYERDIHLCCLCVCGIKYDIRFVHICSSISTSFGSSGEQCFLIVAFPGELHL